jgi:competence protein ComEC
MINYHAVFFFRILIPYIAGTFLGLYLLSETWQGVLPVFTGLGVYFISLFQKHYFKYKRTYIKAMGVYLIFIGLGILRLHDFQEIRNPIHVANALEQHPFSYAVAEITEISERKSSIRVKANIFELRHDKNESGFHAKGKVLLYLKSKFDAKPKTGNKIVFKTKGLHEINPPKNPGEFNYKQFLSYQNIHHQAFLNENDFRLMQSKNELNFKLIALDIREAIRKKLIELFPDEDVSSFAEALLVGYKDNLDPKLIESFSKTGTLHVLAVSGLHAGIIFLILSRLLFFLDKIPKGHIVKGILIILGMWLYAFVTGLSPSVNRAALMLSFVQIGLLFKRKGNIYNTLSIAAFLMLLYNPLLIVSVSFQLSYTAVLGIVYFQPKIKKLYEAPNKFVKYFWELTAVSLAAQLATFPLGLFYFHQFPTYFLFSNLFIIPLIFLTLILLISTVSFFWIPVAGKVITFISTCFIKFIIYLVVNIKAQPSSSIDGIYISPFEIAFIYMFIIGMSLMIVSESYNRLYLNLIILLILTLSISYRIHENSRQYFIIAHAISKQKQAVSVIKGNYALILCNNSFYEDEEAQKFYLRPFLAKHGISKLKLLNLTNNSDLTYSNYDTYSFLLTNDRLKITYKKNIDIINIQHLNSNINLNSSQYFSVFK